MSRGCTTFSAVLYRGVRHTYVSCPLTRVNAMAEKKKKVSVYLDSETLEEVEQEATDQERSISYVISKMVEEQLRNKKDGDKSDDK